MMAPTPSRQKMKGKGKGSRSDSKAAVKKVRTTHSGDGKRTKQSKPTRKSPRAKATKKNTNVDPLEMHAKKHIQVLRQRRMIVEHDGVCHAHFLMQLYSSL